MDLDADEYAVTDLGSAFEKIAAQLEIPPMPLRALPPVIVLLSDGLPTDDWKKALKKLLSMPWGKKAVKVAIAIGKRAERSVLEAFTGNRETVFDANNPDKLVHLIRWASTIASTVSTPVTMPDEVKPNTEGDSSGEGSSEETGELPAPNPYIQPPDLSSIAGEDVF